MELAQNMEKDQRSQVKAGLRRPWYAAFVWLITFYLQFYCFNPTFGFLSVAFWVSLHPSLCRNLFHLILALYKSCPFCYNTCP